MQQITIEQQPEQRNGFVKIIAQGQDYSAWDDAWKAANRRWYAGQTITAHVHRKGCYNNLYPNPPKQKGNSANLDKTNALLAQILAELRFMNGKGPHPDEQTCPQPNDRGQYGNRPCQSTQPPDIPYGDSPPPTDDDYTPDNETPF